jgi:sugar lactone lactonase YvrE
MVGKILRLLILLILLAVAALGLLRLYFGGGQPYGTVAGEPILEESGISVAASYPEPIGNVAVSASGRLFFTVHPEARTEGPKLLEWRDGNAVPFPDIAIQRTVFDSPLGIVADRQNRLWVIDPAGHGLGRPRIVAVDLATGLVVHEHVFPREIAPRGSFLQDLQVDATGRMIYIADLSLWRDSPALVVYDTATRQSRRLLQDHRSVRPQDWLIRTPAKEMRFVGGVILMKPGLDGIALGPAGEWLYYGAMTNDTLYRIPTAALMDASLGERQLEELVEAVGRKPLSDGLSADLMGNVYITDVEHGAVMRMAPGGALTTVIRTPRIRWADALSFGPGGWLYVADSALPDVILRTRGQIASTGPYYIYRFQPGTSGVPGQ